MKAIMFQGTSSDAGKSTMTALLCRYLSERGVKVAPFKAINVTLNAFVTKHGGEIGISQAFQAWAAGIEPEVEMNPIIIKPEGGGRLQYIINGRAQAMGHIKVSAEWKALGLELIQRSMAKLAERYEVVVCEGSGSPVEVNLPNYGLANMDTARIIKAPVILVADIDKGGSFASIFGTYVLYEENERRMLKGFILNRFRGDASVLTKGVEEIENRTSAKCIGVMPFVDVSLPAEDGLSLMDGRHRGRKHMDIRDSWLASLDDIYRVALRSLDFQQITSVLDEGL